MSVEIDEGDGGLFAAVVILTFVGIVLLYWLWIKSVRIVRHSEVMILERFGKYHVRVPAHAFSLFTAPR